MKVNPISKVYEVIKRTASKEYPLRQIKKPSAPRVKVSTLEPPEGTGKILSESA